MSDEKAAEVYNIEKRIGAGKNLQVITDENYAKCVVISDGELLGLLRGFQLELSNRGKAQAVLEYVVLPEVETKTRTLDPDSVVVVAHTGQVFAWFKGEDGDREYLLDLKFTCEPQFVSVRTSVPREEHPDGLVEIICEANERDET